MSKLKLAIFLDMLAVLSVIVAFVLFVVNEGQMSFEQIILVTGVLVLGMIALFTAFEFSKESRTARIMGVILWISVLFVIGAYVFLKYYMIGQMV